MVVAWLLLPRLFRRNTGINISTEFPRGAVWSAARLFVVFVGMGPRKAHVALIERDLDTSVGADRRTR